MKNTWRHYGCSSSILVTFVRPTKSSIYWRQRTSERLPVAPLNSTERTSIAYGLILPGNICRSAKDQVEAGQALCPTLFLTILKELRSLLVDDLLALANGNRFGFCTSMECIRARKGAFRSTSSLCLMMTPDSRHCRPSFIGAAQMLKPS